MDPPATTHGAPTATSAAALRPVFLARRRGRGRGRRGIGAIALDVTIVRVQLVEGHRRSEDRLSRDQASWVEGGVAVATVRRGGVGVGRRGRP